MEVNQGELYWLALREMGSLEAGIPHPHVIIQDDVIPASPFPAINPRFQH